eukprot:3432014-Rhodomonas_salina.4
MGGIRATRGCSRSIRTTREATRRASATAIMSSAPTLPARKRRGLCARLSSTALGSLRVGRGGFRVQGSGFRVQGSGFR